MLKTILIAEDDKEIRKFVKESLIDNSYVVVEAEDGVEALKMFDKKMPDMVILDLGLPKISGETVCKQIKTDYPNTPVIILTAKSQPAEVVGGFKLGADDYVAKPFIMDVLLARVKARFNARGEEMERLKVADLELNNKTKEVKRAGRLIPLTPKEFELLYYMMANAGQVLSRDTILNKIWLYSPDIESRVVDVYIGYLRKKIDFKGKKKLIQSVRGFGYSIKK
ncbi:response regulator transcription factor [Candidatus Roizmanbacteria bacterium]|nr:response regulator transcription factor [Candidatus Roizmanbacteria bacterium]